MAMEVGMSTLVALIAFGALAWALYDIREAETGKGPPEAWADLERSVQDAGKDKGPTES